MHIIFLNPQGNFDENDSHLTEHPDFGGQLIYVKEICMSLSNLGNKVDIITRWFDDPDWPEFTQEIDYYKGYEDNLRIVRIPCGPKEFLPKEKLWEYLDEWVDNIVKFYGDNLPDFATGHYGDGGYSGALLKKKTGIGFTFTGHSLGAQKLDKMGMNTGNFKEINERYFFSKRIVGERMSMKYASRIITSTSQERFGQYSHDLYEGVVDVNNDSKFAVIPPGVNLKVFNQEITPLDEELFKKIDKKIGDGKNKPFIVSSSRLDEKKNQIGIVKAYAYSKELQEKANLGIFLRGIEDPYTELDKLNEKDRRILLSMVEVIKENNLKDKVYFLDLRSQKELAGAYKYFAKINSLFALTAFYEPFGLAPIEAAACGLACVATKNGGPSEIFADGSGIVVDPQDEKDIAKGFLECLNDVKRYAELAEKRVKEKYTWDKTAEGYFGVIKEEAAKPKDDNVPIDDLDASERILEYLKEK